MTPWVKRLLIVNILIWVLFWPGLFGAGLSWEFVRNYLALVPADLHVRPWTAVTYMFLHAQTIWHILFNMIVLFFFGPRVEAKLGGTHFLILYFVSGLMGAIFSLVTPMAAVIGASGAVLGVLYGFARYWPRERIYIWAILPVEARFLVGFLVIFSIVAGFGGAQDGVAHFAHLGGLVGGFVFLFWRDRNTRAAKFKRKVEGPRVHVVSGRDVERWRSVDPEDLHPLNRQEYERILGKVEEKGADSLTPLERGFLDRFVRD